MKSFTPSASSLSPSAVTSTIGRQADEYFGCNVWDPTTAKHSLGQSAWQQYERAVADGSTVDVATADAISSALLSWAKERGATHFTHWFQPISNSSATGEKHDTFLDLRHEGGFEIPISRFTHRQLCMSEPDGSSFPSGGLRSTHKARAYAAWDPTSPPFILDDVLYIPAMFFSWDGKALDEKIPLLRSERALKRAVLDLYRAIGNPSVQRVHTDSGLEQEFFLVDRQLFLKRPDLMATGRTVFGALPPKHQQLEDQYWGTMGERTLPMLQELEREMWKLGVPVQTRHREVAPGSYEVAPRFAPANVATDRNLLLMTVLRRIARRHQLEVLLHAKPFARVNGSGKHNNWSLGTNNTPSVFQPGPAPHLNVEFMFFVAATARAVDLHADVMRAAFASASNDHRLGQSEAPPCIVSMYMGDDVSAAIDRFLAGDESPDASFDSRVDLNISTPPPMQRQSTDRNRTSTFAFTGNKFEFRALGASQNPARSNTVLNTILADSIESLTERLNELIGSNTADLTHVNRSMAQVARETLIQHQRIIFNQDGYSSEWVAEATRRGLPVLSDTPASLKALAHEKNVQLFSRLGVLTEDEFQARLTIYAEDYIKKTLIDARCAAELTINDVYPACVKYLKLLNAAGVSEGAVAVRVMALAEKASGLALQLRAIADEFSAHDIDGLEQSANCRDRILPLMAKLRTVVDEIELLLPRDMQPYPTYEQFFSLEL